VVTDRALAIGSRDRGLDADGKPPISLKDALLRGKRQASQRCGHDHKQHGNDGNCFASRSFHSVVLPLPL
jgi:hypothetical protein